MAKTTESVKSRVDAVLLVKKSDDELSLFVLLGKDGSINRMGSGSDSDIQKDMFIGITKEPLFQNFMDSVPEMFVEAPRATLGPAGERLGKKCQISLMFKSGADESGLSFIYGSESQGPPSELLRVVTRAIEITEPWYQQQKKNAQAQR